MCFSIGTIDDNLIVKNSKKLLFWTPVLPITHKTFRHGGNLEWIAGNPGNPFRQKEKKSLKNFLSKPEEFWKFSKMSESLEILSISGGKIKFPLRNTVGLWGFVYFWTEKKEFFSLDNEKNSKIKKKQFSELSKFSNFVVFQSKISSYNSNTGSI